MDRRVTKTKTAIRDAYFRLLRQTSSEHVPIAQIAREANIDRKTFYLHYESVEEIIHEYILEKTNELLEHLLECEYFDKPLRTDLLFSALDQSLSHDSTLVRTIFNSSYAQFFWNDVVNIIVNTTKEIYAEQITCPMEDFQIYIRFIANASVATYKDWLNQDLKTDKKRLVELTQSVTHLGLDHFIRSEKR